MYAQVCACGIGKEKNALNFVSSVSSGRLSERVCHVVCTVIVHCVFIVLLNCGSTCLNYSQASGPVLSQLVSTIGHVFCVGQGGHFGVPDGSGIKTQSVFFVDSRAWLCTERFRVLCVQPFVAGSCTRYSVFVSTDMASTSEIVTRSHRSKEKVHPKIHIM